MKTRNLSLIVKITGVVLLAFLLVLGNEIRLGIDRYIKNTLETDANAIAKDLDKFYKAYSESSINSRPDFTSGEFLQLYDNALLGDSTKVKCLADANGKILDISREAVENAMLSVTVSEYKGSVQLPIHFDLSSLSIEQIKALEDNLKIYQNEIIYATIVMKLQHVDYIEQENDPIIESISFNGTKIIQNEDLNSETETVEGIVDYYSSDNLEITFPPINLEMYNKSLALSLSKEDMKTVVYDYQNTTNGLEDQLTTRPKDFINSGQNLSTNYGNYYLLKPYEYNGKYYSTLMIRLLDSSKVDALVSIEGNSLDVKNTEIITNVTAGYIFVAEEYDNLQMNSLKQFIVDNSSTYLLAFLLIIIICILIGQMIVRPIRRIETTAKHIARKEFDYPIDMTRHDEIGNLAGSIDTMSKELEKTISNLHQEIERVEKMESLRKDFVSNFTHEIKTPLGIINGFSELVEIENDEVKRNEYIKIIQGETNRINQLVLAMLDLSKLESEKVTLDIKEVDLFDIVNESIESMLYLFQKKNIELISDLKSATVKADQFKIEMVVQNFMSNALRYTDEGKQVEVYLDDHKFSIENIGSHIPEDQIDKIWYTFHKIDKSRNEEGTGLGLAICKAILDMHHFQYGVENTEKGVLFYVLY